MAYALSGRNDFLREPALLISILAHAVVLLLVGLNLDLMPRRPPQPVRLAIQATVVDAKTLRERAAAQERSERQAEQRRQQQELERQREAERRQLEQKRVADERIKEQREARERQVAEERKRREQAEQKRRAEAKQKQEAEKARQARAEEDRRKAAEQKRVAEEARRKADAERREAQRKNELQSAIAAEEALNAAEESGLLDQYLEVIRQKVERNWIRPASARAGISCVVLVTQMPGGDVVNARVTECNGDAAVVRSIEIAVLRSSPLPLPPDPALFERNLKFVFKPED
jgi:colicin import membrane protein